MTIMSKITNRSSSHASRYNKSGRKKIRTIGNFNRYLNLTEKINKPDNADGYDSSDNEDDIGDL